MLGHSIIQPTPAKRHPQAGKLVFTRESPVVQRPEDGRARLRVAAAGPGGGG